MAVDPTDPETFDENGPNAEAAKRGEPALEAEVPEADAAEQHTEVNPQHDEPLTHIDADTADEADAMEQARVVGLDEDDYR
ncbi:MULTISPECIES: hypothetical protein [Streptomyces]|uniref:Uncharacterized protein n=2 Tax=Streptomyces TaxID=1883 RepID=A0A646KU76_STRJU|nr:MULTISPECIES: hypothetical protein [Streptomyces]MQS35564.1 hypothetical protein [Streptomyces katsurahamanus]MQT04556.1 hypothetical protein [Streptomyces jumonjinensis]